MTNKKEMLKETSGKKIECERYYIFANVIGGIVFFDSLKDLKLNSKEAVKKFENLIEANETNSDFYIAVGAEYRTDDEFGYGSTDFINKKSKNSKFTWCKDVETQDINVPKDFRNLLQELIEVL